MSQSRNGSLLWACWGLGVALVAGCGGGGEDETASATYLSAQFRNQQSLFLLALDDGTLYGFYQSDFSRPSYTDFNYAGFFVGQRQSATPEASTYQTTQFDFADPSRMQMTVILSGIGGTRWLGTTQRPQLDEEAFSAEASSSASAPTEAESMPGAYLGQMRALGTEGHVQWQLTSAGDYTAQFGADCSFTGHMDASPTGNRYRVNASMGAACPALQGEYFGVGLQSQLTGNVYLMLSNATRTQGIWVQLTAKQ